ncbi:MAG: aspartate:alanine exchanger family transporter [Chloroflexota bacterium]
MVVLFAILAIGTWLGQLSVRRISLGAAAVLFTAMIFGHFGLSIPKGVMDLGLLLFVYAVGLQAGPRFFRTFRRHGVQFLVIALAVAAAGMLATVGVGYFLRLPPTLAAGMFTGALTCTPALAAAIDIIERLAPGSSGQVSVGYGLAYPFSMIGVVLLVQFLPRLARRDLPYEEARWRSERESESPALQARQFRITNPNCDGKQVRELNPHRMTLANISRIKHGEQVFAASPEACVYLNDVVMVVGPPDELDKMQFLLGEETHERMDVNGNVLSVDVEVTEPALTGIKLADMKAWERYTVVITRIRRQGVELIPTGAMTLEMGDNLRVVGDKAAAEEFVRLVHGRPHKAEETNMLPFLIGLLLGILLGALPITLASGLEVRLGSAGGAFLVSLLVGHFGGLGPLKLYVPPAAKNLSRELGLMLFLAGAGINAGSHFVEILAQQGVRLLFGGALITTAAVLAGLLVTHVFYRMNLLATMGALSAAMTNPPGLGAANAQTETDLPTLYYASVYPAALIFKIVLAQVLAEVLARIL